jgi:hypothetical protein
MDADLEQLTPVRLRSIILNVCEITKGSMKMRSRPLWALVKGVFGVGSTSAKELCRRAELDPETTLPIK